jgi:hypothetical protein
VEDAFMAPEDDDVVSYKDTCPDSGDIEDHASELDGREEKGREDSIKWIKREITKQVGAFSASASQIREGHAFYR